MTVKDNEINHYKILSMKIFLFYIFIQLFYEALIIY